MRRLAGAMTQLCRGSEAVAAAEAAVSLLEPLGPSIELARAYCGLAGLRTGHETVIELAKRAQMTAEQLGAMDVLSDALNTQACAVAAAGRDWAGLLRRALDIALTEGLEAQAARAYCNLCGMYGDQRRFAEAEPYFADGIAYCDERDLYSYSTFLRGEQANVLERTGRWAEAAAVSTELLSKAGPSPVNRLCALKRLGLIRARLGEPGVWEYLDPAVAGADGTGEPTQVVPVRLARAEAYWLEGRPGEAAREAELADDLSALCGAWDRGAIGVWLHRTRSARSLRENVAEPFRRQLDGDGAKAAQLWTDLGCPYDAALALHDTSDEAALREALGILTDLGASGAARLTRQKMRQLGIRSIPAGPRTATRAHPLGLTQREHEVLDLICAGHTNAEIAGQLFISEKTVDHHVSAMLAKLNAPTRHAAAAAAARLGLVSAAQI